MGTNNESLYYDLQMEFNFNKRHAEAKLKEIEAMITSFNQKTQQARKEALTIYTLKESGRDFDDSKFQGLVQDLEKDAAQIRSSLGKAAEYLPQWFTALEKIGITEFGTRGEYSQGMRQLYKHLGKLQGAFEQSTSDMNVMNDRFTIMADSLDSEKFHTSYQNLIAAMDGMTDDMGGLMYGALADEFQSAIVPKKTPEKAAASIDIQEGFSDRLRMMRAGLEFCGVGCA